MSAGAARLSAAELIGSGVLEIGDGYRAKNVELASTGIPFARAQNLNNGFDFTGADLYPVSNLGRVGTKMSRPGDCVFTSKGSVGRVGYVGLETPPFVYSPQLSFWRSLDPKVVEPQYLRYWLQGPEFGIQRDAVKGSTDMADYVNLRDQRRMSITLPPAATQRKIGAILSAYDDLIEKNSRRIKVLEEMAQRIYREWFVEFRYPGDERAPFTTSELGPVPHGWHTPRLADVCARITDGAHASPATSEQGLRMASVKDMTSLSIEISTCRKISEADYWALCRQGCRPEVGDVLVSKDGAKNLEKAFALVDPIDIVLLSSVAILRPGPDVLPMFLASAIRDEATKARLGRRVSGAAIPRVVLQDFKAFRVVLPPLELQARFDDCAGVALRLAGTLEKSNRDLRTARDILLPRLISGEIDLNDHRIELVQAPL